jgi:hypothetical protein
MFDGVEVHAAIAPRRRLHAQFFSKSDLVSSLVSFAWFPETGLETLSGFSARATLIFVEDGRRSLVPHRVTLRSRMATNVARSRTPPVL